MIILTTEQMRQVEKLTDASGITYEKMMENAGTKSFQYLESRYKMTTKKTVILAGNGNNAGDGFVLAQKILENKGHPILLLCQGPPKSTLAQKNYKAYLDMGGSALLAEGNESLAIGYLSLAEIIVDAVFGIGFHGELPRLCAVLIAHANEAKATRIALDIPSGMEADTGKSGDICFQADITLSFAAYKKAHTQLTKVSCGVIEVLDIGVPEEVIFQVLYEVEKLSEEKFCQYLPEREEDSHKGNYGKLCILAGSRKMGGAAMMATMAALRCGCGTTTLASPASVCAMVASSLMEAMTLPLPETDAGAVSSRALPALREFLSGMSACLIGCGLTITNDSREIVRALVQECDCQLILDADALNAISENPVILKHAKKPPVLTPHFGEMARLTGTEISQISENPVKAATLFAVEFQCVLVLKSHKTLIATPEGRVFQNTTGNAGLAKGGSGDLLAGMIASFAAQGLTPEQAACCGVYLHGKAADELAKSMSEYAMLARDILGELPFSLKKLGR